MARLPALAAGRSGVSIRAGILLMCAGFSLGAAPLVIDLRPLADVVLAATDAQEAKEKTPKPASENILQTLGTSTTGNESHRPLIPTRSIPCQTPQWVLSLLPAMITDSAPLVSRWSWSGKPGGTFTAAHSICSWNLSCLDTPSMGTSWLSPRVLATLASKSLCTICATPFAPGVSLSDLRDVIVKTIDWARDSC